MTVALSRLHELQSFDPDAFDVPRGREEEWRFTPLRRLRGLHADAAFGDGKVSVVADAGPAVTIAHAQHGDPQIGAAYVPADRVSARAFAAVDSATILTVAEGTESTEPAWVSVRGEDSSGAAAGHIVVNVEPNAHAVVVVEYSGSATYADNVELVVGDGASLAVVSLQEWSDDSVHLSHHHARLGRDARLTHTAVSLGGSLVRLAPSVRYAGPGGDATLRGLYFADAGQHLEHRLFVDHAEPNCRSRVFY